MRDLSEPFPGSEHVRNLGLDSGTSDGEIFEYAREHGFTNLSKDSDVRQWIFVRGAPPKVVWLRIGNCTVTPNFIVSIDLCSGVLPERLALTARRRLGTAQLTGISILVLPDEHDAPPGVSLQV